MPQEQGPDNEEKEFLIFIGFGEVPMGKGGDLLWRLLETRKLRLPEAKFQNSSHSRVLLSCSFTLHSSPKGKNPFPFLAVLGVEPHPEVKDLKSQ